METFRDLRERRASEMIGQAMGMGFTSEHVYALRFEDGKYLRRTENEDGTTNTLVREMFGYSRKNGKKVKDIYDNHHDEVTTDNLDDAYTGFFLVTSKESSLYGIKKALGGKFVELEVHCEDAYYKEIDGDFHHWDDPDKG